MWLFKETLFSQWKTMVQRMLWGCNDRWYAFAWSLYQYLPMVQAMLQVGWWKWSMSPNELIIYLLFFRNIENIYSIRYHPTIKSIDMFLSNFGNYASYFRLVLHNDNNCILLLSWNEFILYDQCELFPGE